MKEYFKCKVRYDKTQEDGSVKKVTEEYLVDAMSFTEAEERITREMGLLTSGDFLVVDISRYNVQELIIDYPGNFFYRFKVDFITLDEKSGKEKKRPNYLLVQAADIDDARDQVVKAMKESISDYSISKIEETKIIEVFIYNAKN